MDRKERIERLAAHLLPAVVGATRDGSGLLNASLGHPVSLFAAHGELARQAWRRSVSIAEACLAEQDEMDREAAERAKAQKPAKPAKSAAPKKPAANKAPAKR